MTSWRAMPALAPGIALLDAGDAHAAHEAFERAWRTLGDAPEGRAARALAQWSAACVQAERGRHAGFASLAAKSARTLASAPWARDLGTEALGAWIEECARRGARPTHLLPAG